MQGQFTKEEAMETRTAVKEIFNALTKRKQMEYLGHFNDILLFISAAHAEAPNESKTGEG